MLTRNAIRVSLTEIQWQAVKSQAPAHYFALRPCPSKAAQPAVRPLSRRRRTGSPPPAQNDCAARCKGSRPSEIHALAG